MSDLSEPLILDAMGQPCPMPLLMLKRQLKRQNHQVLMLKSSDPHSMQDIMHYCQIHELRCQPTQVSDHEFHYKIEC